MRKAGNRIRMMCMVYHMSQKGLSDISGVKLTVINKAARDIYLPRHLTLERLAQGLQVTEPWLAFGEGQIFTKRLVFLNLTTFARKTQGPGWRLPSPDEVYNAADYILTHEALAACNVIGDEIRTDVRYYMCTCNKRNIVFATDTLTAPGLERILKEKRVTVTVEAAPDLHRAVELIYSDERDIEKALALIGRKIGFENLKEKEITLPERIGGGRKAHILAEHMRELKADTEDIMEAIRLYQRDNAIDTGWNNVQAM